MNNNSRIWCLLVPTKMDESPVRKVHHKNWDRYVRKITGGLTIFSPAKGQWVDNNNDIVEERMIPVHIACTDKEIDAIAQFSIIHYRQDAIIYYLISDSVVIKHASVDDRRVMNKMRKND